MRTFKKYGITILIGMIAVACILWAKDIFGQNDPKSIYHILSDAFFVVGTVILCAGLLVLSSNEGTFDMLVYGVSSFLDMFRTVSKKKYETFYDYRVSRYEKKLPFGFLLISSLLFLGIAFVMYYQYCQYL